MGHKNKEKYGIKKGSTVQSQPVLGRKKKSRFSTGIKMCLALSVVLILIIAGYFSTQSTQPAQQTQSTEQYPQTARGIFYSSPTIAPDRSSVTLPYGVVNESKLVFLDLKLEKQTDEFTYQGRTIPLSLYRNGEYLPLIVILTPSQKVISGIRVCEPCGSFGFHIIQRRYLVCDACGTRWDIETLTGLSGGCLNYPPPKLTSSTGSNIDIDLSPLKIEVMA